MEKIKENLVRHMEMLCLKCGSRHCGSEGEKMAADYIESEFKKMGYETVREEYPVYGWELKNFSLWNVTKQIPVPCSVAAFYSPSVDIEGNLMWLKSEDINILDELELKGKFCFVETAAHPLGINRISEILDEKGAAAAIFISAGSHLTYVPSTKAPRSPFVKNMGVASVNREGAYHIAKNKNDTYRLIIEADKFDTVSCNVIARHIGKTGKKGVIGGHYDTAPGIQGALDNATGTAVVLELARLYKDKLNDEISLDFCAFSAEEYIVDKFPPGSGNYVERHKNENLKWYFNIDTVGHYMRDKYMTTSNKEKMGHIRLRNVEMRELTSFPSDDKPFGLSGIPTIMLVNQTPFGELHTVYDSLDVIDYDNLIIETMDNLDILNQLTKQF